MIPGSSKTLAETLTLGRRCSVFEKQSLSHINIVRILAQRIRPLSILRCSRNPGCLSNGCCVPLEVAGWDQLPDLTYHILSPSGSWLNGVKQWIAHHQFPYHHQKNCIEAAWRFLVKFSGLVSAVALFSSLAALQPHHAVDKKRRHREDSPKLRPSSVDCAVSYSSARVAQTTNRKRCFTASILTCSGCVCRFIPYLSSDFPYKCTCYELEYYFVTSIDSWQPPTVAMINDVYKPLFNTEDARRIIATLPSWVSHPKTKYAHASSVQGLPNSEDFQRQTQ